MNNNGNRKIDCDQIFWGLLLIAAGTLLLLGRLGIADFSWTLHKFWPLVVVIIGISKLFHRRSIWGGLWMITLGAWLQAVTLHFHGFTYESSWPLLLVILGAGIIVRTIFGSPRGSENEERENDHV
jgi:lia operon protein LiaF